MIKLIIFLIAAYGIGFAVTTLYFLKFKNETLEVSVKKGALWWKIVYTKMKAEFQAKINN